MDFVQELRTAAALLHLFERREAVIRRIGGEVLFYAAEHDPYLKPEPKPDAADSRHKGATP